MSDTICKETNEPILGYENAHIIVYPSKCGEAHFVDVDWLFEAIAKGKGEGMKKMLQFIDRNRCIFG